MIEKISFGDDLSFLKKYHDVVLLERGEACIAVLPGLQGRVMTSSAGGHEGPGFGWINYDLIRSRQFLRHCNNFGGEDRFWIGPEGGQYSIFFAPGTAFDLENWQTPAPIDTESWLLRQRSEYSAILEKDMKLVNYQGTVFELAAGRTVNLLDRVEVERTLGAEIPRSLRAVGFRSDNRITNTGNFEWNRETGMLSIWILGQFISSDSNTVIIPYDPTGKGDIVNDGYFGNIQASRLKIVDDVVLFKGDGKKRGKIGLGKGRAKDTLGSYDAESKVLTVVKYSLDSVARDYVNSYWGHQEQPFAGDVVNSYNDGPLPDGSQMGPFYELESSSPANNLNPGEALSHQHVTVHLTGPEEDLENLSRQILGTDFAACFTAGNGKTDNSD